MNSFEGGDSKKPDSNKQADSNPLGMEAFEKPKPSEQQQQAKAEQQTGKTEAPKSLDTSAFSDKSTDASSDSSEAPEETETVENYKQKEIDNSKAIAALPTNTTTSIANKIVALSTPEGRTVVKEGVVTAYNDMKELPKMAAKMLHPGNPNPPVDPISMAAGSSWEAHTKTIEAIV